jgi:O-acetylhomoserine (thiol)-lyase
MDKGDHKGPKPIGFDTLSLHAGQTPDATGARATPIYQTASFVFPDTEVAAGLFNIERAGHVYSRLSNPTNAVLEERMAALDQGVGAIVTASGQAATHLGVTTLLSAGDHIVSSRSLYGGTHNLFSYTLKRFGIETTFVDPRDVQAFAAAVQPNTKLIFGEVLGNPGLEMLNIPAVADMAHSFGIPLMVDATLATPYLCQPIALGADMVVHSATKFLSGHGVVVGGVLVDGGTFDWSTSDKFPTMTEPYEGFHNLVFAEAFGPQAFITRARKEGIRDFGACMAPMSAFQIMQGLETLSLRMDKHVSNTHQVAHYLQAHAQVAQVNYPGLADHPDHALTQQLMPKGAGAVLTLSLQGGRPAGKVFIESLELFSHLANIGDAKSLVIHPASTTHHRMDAAALAAAGIDEGMVRISVGLEDANDLIADLGKGLRAVEKLT